MDARERAIRDTLVEGMRDAGIEVDTDWRASERLLEEANGGVRLSRGQKRTLETASVSSEEEHQPTVISSVDNRSGDRGNSSAAKDGRHTPLNISDSDGAKVLKKIEKLAKNYEEKSNRPRTFINDVSETIPLRDEDFKLAPYIMVCPDRITKGSWDATGRKSIRFEKDLSNGVVLVVEKEQKSSPDDMDTITMWATLSSEGTDARSNKRPLSSTSQPAQGALRPVSQETPARTVISGIDAAKIRKDAENAIKNDKKIKQHKVYHGSGADFDAFDHSHMGEGEGAQAYGWISEYQHYVCGLKIGNEDYTVHALVAVDNVGNRYYNHNLVQIEKGKLLDHVNGKAVIEGFGTTPSTELTTNSERKVNSLLSILQINPEEISRAEERLRELEAGKTESSGNTANDGRTAKGGDLRFRKARRSEDEKTLMGVHSYEVQKIEVLDEQTPNTPNGVDTLNSELEGYPLAKVIQNIEKTMENGKKLLDATRA